jgi:hypothetical protein
MEGKSMMDDYRRPWLDGIHRQVKMNKMTTTIRYSADASICLIDDGDQFRAPTQEDMDTLPVGDDLTEDEIASIENDV